MLRSLILIFALFAFNANANAEINVDPYSDYINLEIDKLELEQELFGNQAISEAISIASISLYEIGEELNLNFSTKKYLPVGFNAMEGMNDIDWDTIELYELEEELEIGFDTKRHLPMNFNALRGLTCDDMIALSFTQ